MAGEMQFAMYPNGTVVLTFSNGYSLHPDAKSAAKSLPLGDMFDGARRR
jgi:hypothetical protein